MLGFDGEEDHEGPLTAVHWGGYCALGCCQRGMEGRRRNSSQHRSCSAIRDQKGVRALPVVVLEGEYTTLLTSPVALTSAYAFPELQLAELLCFLE
jgi:hypothetical protein